MAKPNLSAKLEALAEGVVGPMVLGGRVRLSPPLGPQVGLALGADGRRIVDDALRSRVDVARVRVARQVAPVDTLPDLSPAEWSLAAALNDLMQATNHELSGPLTRGRHEKVLDGVARLLEWIPAPRTTLEALVRHATFARLLEIVRTDTVVSWWVGSEHYRGRPPSKRLTAWPEFRRVTVTPKRVTLSDMCEGLPAASTPHFQALLSRLLMLTPLTDIATARRHAPSFHWTKPTLELVGYPIGRSLALRTFSRANVQEGLAALRLASDRLLPGSHLREIADSFARDVLTRVAGHGERGAHA